ncbi:MAG: M20/M25/M40 family metallo-hydrolase [Clostridia bacterium]|nr:M20/M25/M40 family metallo-hydrolase [Clostridia bacterium]
MKASESVKNYPSSLRMYTNYTVREIKKICQTIGPRESGSESERKAQEHFADEMKTCCDKVEIEDFKMSKYAFMAWVVIAAVFGLVAIAASFFVPVVSLVLILLAFLCTVTEFVKYWEFLEPIFPKSTSCNAVGVRAPKGEVKQRIVFSGHADSAYEWTYTYLGGKNLLFGIVIPAVLGLVYVLVVSIISVAMSSAEETPLWLSIVQYAQFVFVPFFIAALFFTNFKRPVMGANDNLTGAVASVAVLKYLEDNGIRFENTEVVAVTTGCEETGLRGAKAYTKNHLDELKAIPTAFVALDTLKDYECMAIYNKDMTGTVKNDPRVCALIKKGAERAGLDLPYESVYLGASDAARVTTLGVPAATLAAMDPGPPRYYHTRLDTIEELEMKTVEKCLDICLQTLFIYDEFGLKENYDDVEVDAEVVSPKSKN